MVKKKGIFLYLWNKKHRFIDYFHYLGKILGAVVSIFFFLIFVMFFASFFSSPQEYQIPEGNIAVIPLNGVITTGTDQSAFIGEEIISSTKIVKLLDKIDKNSKIKGVILEINSPGGSPVASAEIGNAVKSLNKTVVSVIRETGASGGYWVASASDRIFANDLSITGSIGVIASKLAFPGLLKEYNITYQRLIAGKYKDAGSPYKEMTDEERTLYQKVLDKTHEAFIKEVARNRNLDVARVKELATGFVFLGSEAKDLGLIDEIGGRKEAIKYLEKELNLTAKIAEVKIRIGLFGPFSEGISSFGYNVGKGFGNSLIKNSQRSSFEVLTAST